MNKICTTIDQCKKLLDLGIDINTADLTVTNLPLQDGSRFDFICCKLPNDTFSSITDGKSEKIPAWSLSALLELIPESIDDNTVDFSQLKLTKKSVAYYYGDGTLRCGFLKDNFINAAFDMVVWLKEKGKI